MVSSDGQVTLYEEGRLVLHLERRRRPRPGSLPAVEVWIAVAGVVLAALLLAVAVRARRRRARAIVEAYRTPVRHGLADALAPLVQGSLGLLASLLARDAEDGPVVAEDGTITLLFSDIEGSTRLNVDLGDREWARVLAVHDRLVAEQVGGHRGHVVKTQGDGFMAAFPDATDAVRCAVALREGLRDHPEVAVPLRLRIGVHSGEVVGRDGDFFGTNVTLAARVTDRARGDEILITDAVVDRMADDPGLRLTARRPMRLRDLPGRHRLHRVEV